MTTFNSTVRPHGVAAPDTDAPADASVAGEEDPGAALDLTSDGATADATAPAGDAAPGLRRPRPVPVPLPLPLPLP